MSKLFIEDSSLTAIGNAIRAKTGKTGLLSVPSGMVAAINSISGSSGGDSAVIQPLTITANGTYAAPSGVDGYSPVLVNVPIPSSDDDITALVRKTITTYSDDEVEVIRRYIFDGCYNLTSVDIPNTKEIKEYAFYNCHRLNNINAPLLETIGERAFSTSSIGDYVDLNIDFPNVITIGNSAFLKKGELKSIDCPLAETIGSYAFFDCWNLNNINFPSATYIGDYAFDYCRKLTTNISFPLVENIGAGAFRYCEKITYANFPKITSIASDVFQYCSELQSINALLVQSIGKQAFSSCSALTSVNFPNVITLGTNAFSGSGIRSAYLPEITTLSNYTFQYCASLEDVDIPKATSIGQYSFDSCKALTTLDLPLVQSIGNYAFLNCASLTSLILRNSTMCSLSNVGAFQLTPIEAGTGYIYVPFLLLEEYQNATNWNVFRGQFRALEDYTVDGTTTGALDETKINR